MAQDGDGVRGAGTDYDHCQRAAIIATVWGMKTWTPQAIACVMLIGTVCVIMLTIEFGIVTRATNADVAESRALLSHTTDLVIGLTAGFFMGKTIHNSDDSGKDEGPKE